MEEDENFQDQICGVLRSHIQRIIPNHVHMQVGVYEYGLRANDRIKDDDDNAYIISLDFRFETSWAKLVKDVIKSNLTHLRFKRRRSNFESEKGRFTRGGASGSRSGAGIYRGGDGGSR
ncbi:hypothetical protein Tco_0963169 [Tanacetum coccineum]